MAQIFNISQTNTFKFYNQRNNWNIAGTFYANTSDLRYNSKHIDDDFFKANILHWQDNVHYFAPWQTTDSTIVQFGSKSNDNNYKCFLLDCNGKQVHEFVTILKATLINGTKIWHCFIDFFDIQPGLYYLQIQHTDFVGIISAVISEPFNLQHHHQGTMLFEYNNSYNSQGMIWNFLKQNPIQKRLFSAFTKIDPNSKNYIYQNLFYDTTLLSGVPYRVYSLAFGGDNNAIPEYEADLINNIFCCDNVKIDGKYFTKNEGANLEDNKEVNHPLAGYLLKVMQKESDNSVTLDPLLRAYLGDVPNTKNFYVGNCCGETIERGFAGKKVFLAYLNSKFKRDYFPIFTGSFTINSDGQLFYSSREAAEVALVQSSMIGAVLPHMLELDINFNGSAGTSTYELDAINGAYAAITVEDGVAVQTNYTPFSAIESVSIAATNKINVRLYLSTNIVSITETISNHLINKLGGDLPAQLQILSISFAPNPIFENNFLFGCFAGAELTLDCTTIQTSEANKLIIYLHECFMFGYLQFYPPNFLQINASGYSSPSDSGLKNLLAEIKKTGFFVDL
jgi:hypothetical protein